MSMSDVISLTSVVIFSLSLFGTSVTGVDNEVGIDDPSVIGKYIVQFQDDASMTDIQNLVSQFGVADGPYEHFTISKCPGLDITSAECESFIKIGDGYKSIFVVMPTKEKDGETYVLHYSEIRTLMEHPLVKNVEADAVVHIAEGGDIPSSSASRIKIGL